MFTCSRSGFTSFEKGDQEFMTAFQIILGVFELIGLVGIGLFIMLIVHILNELFK